MPRRLLDDNLTAALTPLMHRITKEVELVASLDDREASAELWQLLEDIAALSPRVTARRDDAASQRRPAFAICRVGTDIAVRFAGIPMGHEFSSLVLALLQVGGNPIKESPELIEQVKNLPGEYDFTTYFSLSCQNCPTVVQALNTMHVINPRIRHVAVEGSLFQEEIEAKNVLAVPNIHLNGEFFESGRMGIDAILARLDTGAAARAAEALNEKEPYDALVVGQGPAGVAAAIYFARKGLRTGLVGQRFGGQVLDTMSIENVISIPHTEGPRYAAALEAHTREYDVDIIANQRATGLVPAGEAGGLHEVMFGDASLKAREVVIATGARWRTMGVPGEDAYRNKGVTFCPHCDGPLFKGKDIAVIGGGNSGIEAAIDLAGLAKSVTVLEFADHCRADDVLMDAVNALPNTSIVVNAATTEVTGNDTQVTGLTYTDRVSGENRTLDVSGVFVQIGLLPETEWLAESGLTLSDRKEIVVDERGATNIPGIYAAGDCTTEPFKQIVVAQGAGATAALAAWEHGVRTAATAR